ncbi:adenylate/guanylate cyclase domain-containing protein [candidate division KSB1 bacterium]|nr:adenylate/guanylate cyclase domain-containing protein [candidate division KSB1 bacterium]
MESKHFFDEQLSKETLNSERLRATILAGLFGFVALVDMIIYAFFRQQYARIFGSPSPPYRIIIVLGLVVAYESLIRFVIGRRLETRRKIPEFLRYWNAFVETSTPTVLIALIAGAVNPFYTLAGPAVFAYFLFIILSTLRLEFNLCAFTGFVAALEYMALAFIYIGQSDARDLEPVLSAPVYHVGKGLLLLAGGIAAGFVALQIKRRIHHSLRVVNERNRIVNLFGQQVSPAIVDELLKQKTDMPSQKKFVCVMFMDIRNFARFAEHKTPEEVVAYQNTVFGFIIEIINRHHGLINQFLGDGFMATFGAPISYGNDCRHAVEAALEIIARVKAESESGNIPPTRVGIGIHAGEAVTGNVGTPLRRQYSITGNVVILASRLEQLNKQYQSQLLISEEVWEAIGRNARDAVALGPAQIKGRDEPVFLYKLAS